MYISLYDQTRLDLCVCMCTEMLVCADAKMMMMISVQITHQTTFIAACG